MGVARWLGLGAIGTLGAVAWARTRAEADVGVVAVGASHETATRPIVAPAPSNWVFPVGRWRGRRVVVSDGFTSPRPGLPRHGGVDLMFERTPADVSLRAKTPNGSRGGHFVMPDDALAVAAHDGVVTFAAKIATGYAVIVDHAPLHASTFYAHLAALRVRKGDRVRGGEPLGVIGGSPLDGDHLKHLHFELWLGGPADRIDPAPMLATWASVDAADPRNRAPLVYRPIGSPGERYPTWIRALRGKAGVYVIREAGETVYVGSSRTQLYDTVTRHFQAWRRFKGFWRGQYGEGHDPGLTYDRARVELAVRVTSPAEALDEEARLIRRLRPRDNIQGQPPLDEAPFYRVEPLPLIARSRRAGVSMHPRTCLDLDCPNIPEPTHDHTPTWPLARLGTHHPIVTGVSDRHFCLELGYEPSVERPPLVPVLAIGHGTVLYATSDRIVLDHGDGFATAYLGLEHVLVAHRARRARKRGARVQPGQVIGFVTDVLGFEIWRDFGAPTQRAEGLGAYLRQWEAISWARPARTRAIARAA